MPVATVDETKDAILKVLAHEALRADTLNLRVKTLLSPSEIGKRNMSAAVLELMRSGQVKYSRNTFRLAKKTKGEK